MKSLKTRFLLFGTGAAILLMACTLFSPPTPTPDLFAQATSAAQTLAAQITQAVQATETSQPGLPTATPTQPLPTDTPLPTSTATPVPPTATRTPVPIPCNWAEFVKDVTVPDNTQFAPGTKFAKTWRLKNIGSCTWTTDYDLIWVKGDKMTSDLTIALPENVLPGETVDVSANLTAPQNAGDYRGEWMLRSASGIAFGIGAGANSSFWVDIKVIAGNPAYEFDFAAFYCLANWITGGGQISCGDTSNPDKGYVQYLSDPNLENRHEDEPALHTHPDKSFTGWISGFYPEYKVQAGDHFRAWIGCLDESEECDVIFRLQYRINGGTIHTIDEWHEVFDGAVTEVDVDLSSLAGEEVEFILTVLVSGGRPRGANAFWFLPRIEN